MANKKISELQSRTPALSDLMLVGDPSSGYSYKCTVTALATIIETDIADGYVTIGTTQTISGAKTFSNNLTLTSVANATTTQTKFLTLNASNVVNYRTGAEVLADIGGASSSSISGTTNYVAKFTSSSAIGNSQIFDNGTSVGINTATPNEKLEVSGVLRVSRTTSASAYLNLTIENGVAGFDARGSIDQVFYTGALERMRIGFGGDVTLSTIANATIDTDRFLVSDSGVIKYRTGSELLSDIGGQGTISLAAIGSTPNANGATLSSNTLTLQPASASFGGVLTTGFQEIAGWKRFTGNPIQFDNHLEIKNLNSWGVSWGYTSFASKDTPVFGFLRGHSSTGSVTYNAWFTYGTTGDRNYTLPSSDGTLALTSQVPTVSGTTNYIPKFTSSSAIGNSEIYDNGGNIGIGFTSTFGKLSINVNAATPASSGNMTNGFTVANTNGGRAINLGINESGAYSYIQSAYVNNADVAVNLAFFTGATEKMRLDASGNLGLGTSSADIFARGYSGRILGISSSGQSALELNGGSGSAAYFDMGTGATRRFSIYVDGSGSDISTTTSTPLTFSTNSTIRATLDASGNLGLGVTPSAWSVTGKVFEFGGAGGSGSLFDNGINDTWYSSNTYFNGSNWIYKGTGTATQYYQGNGHKWFTAPSGTAGNAISFTQAMTLDASGNLAIGNTNASGKVHITGGSSGADLLFLNTSGATTKYAFKITGAATDYFTLRRNHPTGGDLDIMSWTYGGNVGIGTTSPNYPLEIRKSTGAWSTSDESFGAVLGVYYNTANVGSTQNRFRILANQDAVYLDGYDAFPIIFRNNGNTERMRITSGGLVLIGTSSTSETARLFVKQASDADFKGVFVESVAAGGFCGAMSIDASGNLSFAQSYTGGSGSYQSIKFTTGASERMRITSGGNVGIGTSSPARLLDLYDASTPVFAMHNSTTGTGTEDGFLIYVLGSDAIIQNKEATGYLGFATGGNNERMRIKSTGQVRFVPLASDPTGAESGDVYYNSTTNKLKVYNGTTWVDLH